MSSQTIPRPLIGVPWRTAAEEAAHHRVKIDKYLAAVERAGGQPVLLSLAKSSDQLKRHPSSEKADPARERTDFTLLEHAFGENKPVLAICYGIQSLNVFLGGSLIQDIPSEVGTKLLHSPEEDELPSRVEAPDVMHRVSLEPGRVLALSDADHIEVNSSHHQSVLEPGRGLRVTARAPDRVVEAIEWDSDSNWVVGVQWHPERMLGDAPAEALFRELVAVARLARAET